MDIAFLNQTESCSNEHAREINPQSCITLQMNAGKFHNIVR
jgi:hypothetical protein